MKQNTVKSTRKYYEVFSNVNANNVQRGLEPILYAGAEGMNVLSDDQKLAYSRHLTSYATKW